MNPNLPLYGLASGPNVNMLDNMLMAAGFPATDQPGVAKPSLVPQYSYSQDSALHQHAMNLVQPNTAAASTPSDPVHVIVYQNEAQQQQPISYKLPQLGSAVVQQPAQTFVSQAAGSSGGPQYGSQARPASTTAQSTSQPRHVQSPAERKKDIVAQAMQEQKIFEENLPKSEPMTVKQEPGVAPTQSTMKSATANMKDIKPTLTAGGKIVPPGGSANQVKKSFNRTSAAARQQVVPRIAILEDEDDGLTCRLCLASYWYKKEIHEHLKTVHSIADPDKYDKEEKEKKMKKIKEEQQRVGLSKKQREERERRLAKLGKGKIKLTSPGVRPTQSPGQRPSFQYRDGAFICDLCKESFSDGNDMVTHWKSHVKKQQSDFKGKMQRRPLGRSRHYSSDERSSRSYKKGGGAGDGKKPRWTAYLLWSTRKRREVVVDHPDWSFAQIAKWISEEWKQIDADEKDDLQKEAEEMNELGIRKLPRDDDAPDPNKDTTDEDSDFEEGYRKKTKSSVKVKKEKKEGELYGDESDESDWEPEADVTPVQRENRSGRQRKRPSFFQEFESQENNLDSILAEFEQTQASEFGKPRKPKPPPKNPGEKKERKRKAPAIVIPEPEEPVEVEVLRSGRKRKVRRVMNAFLDEDDEEDKLRRGASSDDDDFEPPPEEEIEKLEENDDLIEEDSELSGDSLDSSDDSSDDAVSELRRLSYDDALPPKKRARTKKILTDAEIEEATRAAMMKTSIEVIRVPKPGEEGGSGGAATNEAGTKPSGLIIAKKSAPSLVVEPAKEGEVTTSAEPATEGNSLAAGPTSSFPDPLNEEESSSTAEPSKETPKFQWVNETLDDDDEQEKGIHKEPSEDALNPLAMEGSGPAAEKNPLEEGGGESGVREAVVTEEDALLATATAPPEPPLVTQAEPAPALPNGTDGMLASEGKGLGELRGKPETGAGKVGLSEEDLLTGPAHNLDDTQYKADYVDPNLDDIFK